MRLGHHTDDIQIYFWAPDGQSEKLDTSGDTEMKEGTDSVLSLIFTCAICSPLLGLL